MNRTTITLFSLLLLTIFSVSLAKQTKYLSTTNGFSIIRSRPNPKSAEVFNTGNNYPLKVIKKHYSWYKVEDFEGTIGWIYHTIVSKNATVVVKKPSNVRYGPGQEYDVYWEAPKYSCYDVITNKGRWIYVQDKKDNTYGWIYDSLVWGNKGYSSTD
jgi:SH3-like domain-containing protein